MKPKRIVIAENGEGERIVIKRSYPPGSVTFWKHHHEEAQRFYAKRSDRDFVNFLKPYMPFNPPTEKQQGMLAYQIRQAHDGSFENCDMDRELLRELQRANEQIDLDKSETSEAISALVQYNEDNLCRPQPLVDQTNKLIRRVLEDAKARRARQV